MDTTGLVPRLSERWAWPGNEAKYYNEGAIGPLTWSSGTELWPVDSNCNLPKTGPQGACILSK